RTPASRPLVQTFVARNNCFCTPSSTARSPTTLSELPYIGEESMTLPCKRTKSPNTALSGSRPDCPLPTSKVYHVPTAVTGNYSPVLRGFGRCMVVPAMAIPPVNAIAPALSASRSTSRRETSRGCESWARTLFGFLILRLDTARRLNKRIITQMDDYWKNGCLIGDSREN